MIQIDANGNALDNLGRYSEAIECFGRDLTIQLNGMKEVQEFFVI